MGKEDKKDYSNMITGPTFFKMVMFSIPVILSGVLQLLFNAADIIVVGKFAGDESLAAVGSTSALINLFTNVFIGLSVGSNVIIAHFIGAGDKERVSRTVHTSIVLSIVSGIFLAIFGFLFANPVLKLMGSPDNVIGLATLYLKIYFMGMPALLIYNFGSAMMRAIGDTKRPLYFLTTSGVLNVILNMILVICFSLGVAGVAIATVVSEYLSAIFILWFLVRKSDVLKLEFKNLRIDKYVLLKIIQIGFPAGLQGTIFSLSNVVIQSAVNSFGSNVVAGNSATMNIEGFVYMAMNAIYQTSLTFVGQNYGAGKKKRVLKCTLQCELIVIIVGLIFGTTGSIFSTELLHIYSDSAAVIAAGKIRCMYILPIYFLCGCMEVMVGSLRAIGQSVIPMITSMIGACALRLVWIATVFQFRRTTGMLYISYPISWIVTLMAHIAFFIYFYKKIPEERQANTQVA
ncbi:MAG: MATE family efflux transporter [Lachnospiraceae bacterium]|nr:MATE family efflux transporter [Lachnospiraceae bacterium]